MLAIFEEENPTKFSRIDPVLTNPTTTSLSCSKQAEQFASYLQTPNNSEVFFIDKKVQNSCSHICNRSFGIFLHWVLFRIQPFMGLLKCKNCHWFYFAFAFCLVSQVSTQELCFLQDLEMREWVGSRYLWNRQQEQPTGWGPNRLFQPMLPWYICVGALSLV